MPEISVVITNAGRAALINASNNGTNAVTIAKFGVSPSATVPAETMVNLPGEIKRIATISGAGVASDVIHLMVRDDGTDAYTMRSFGLYLADGTLFAVYGQAEPIIQKSAASLMLLALDMTLVNASAAQIVFGDTNFLNPPATVDTPGVAELATEAEAAAGTDTARVVTPKALKAAVAAWLDARFGTGNGNVWHPGNDGAGSGLDADLFDGKDSVLFALLASPAFSGTPTAPTAPYGTATDQLATTKFVLGLGGNYNNRSLITSNVTLTIDKAGGLFEIQTAGTTTTLPAAAGNLGKVFAIYNSSEGAVTLKAGNFNSAYARGTDILILPPGGSLILACDGTSWNALGGSGSMGAPVRPQADTGIGQWSNLVASSGTIKLPDGGTWAYFYANNGAGGAGVAAGGATLFSGTLNNAFGFAWRLA